MPDGRGDAGQPWGLIALLPFVALLFACQDNQAAQAPVQPQVLVVINGQPLDTEDFSHYTRWRQQESLGSLSPQRLFHEFVMEQLLLQEAERLGVEVSPEEVEKISAQWFPEREAQDSELRERMAQLLRIRRLLHEQIRPQVQVSLSETLRFYEEHQDDFQVSDQAHVLEILLESREEAERLRSQLKPGDMRAFRQAAVQFSKGVSAEREGDLGIYRRGDLPEEFERVIFSLKVGEISPVFASEFGYHLFMLEEWIPRHAQKFYEVQGEIFERLVTEKERKAVQDYYEQLIQKSSIQVLDRRFQFHWSDTYAFQ